MAEHAVVPVWVWAAFAAFVVAMLVAGATAQFRYLRPGRDHPLTLR